MATPFIETPRFPDDISYGSSGGPMFKTHIFEGSSGLEQRHIAWSIPRAKYDVGYGIRDNSDMNTVRAFFYNMKGKATGFRFKDWSDYSMTQEVIGQGDAAETEAAIIKTYTSGANTFERRIYKIVASTVTVRVDSVAQTEGVDYTLDYDTGIITFASPPGSGLDIDVTCEFDVPVRFDVDHLQASHEGFETENWSSIPLVEIVIEDTYTGDI